MVARTELARSRPKRIMYRSRLMNFMSFRSVQWLAVALLVQLSPAWAQNREEYAVVLRDPPLSRHVAGNLHFRAVKQMGCVQASCERTKSPILTRPAEGLQNFS